MIAKIALIVFVIFAIFNVATMISPPEQGSLLDETWWVANMLFVGGCLGLGFSGFLLSVGETWWKFDKFLDDASQGREG